MNEWVYGKSRKKSLKEIVDAKVLSLIKKKKDFYVKLNKN